MRALAVLLLAAAGVAAQDLEKRLEEKLAKPFLKQVPWATDFDEARALAKKSGKPIFAYFTRSYEP